MVFPKQGITVVDPGFGQTPALGQIPLMTGIAHGGSQAVNTLGSINDINMVRSVVGFGPLAEDIALELDTNGGPVYFIIHNSTQNVALTAAATTHTGTGPAVTVSGSPNDIYNLLVTVVTGGAIGTATFQFSLDAFNAGVAPFTQSAVRPIVSSYPIANSGLTLAFAAGTYVAGETYTLTTVCQEPGTVDLGLAAAVIQALPGTDLELWSVSGEQATATTGAALAAALQGYLTSLTTTYRYARGFIDVGSGDTEANIVTAAATLTAIRVSCAYGYVLRDSLVPFEGYSTRKTSCNAGIAVRAMGSLISTDLARVADGPDDGVLQILFDSFGDQTLDTAQISTMRTWPGLPGLYIAGGKLKCPFGSDFTDVQFGRVMDVACRTTYLAQVPYIADVVRTITGGFIDPRDANAITAAVQGSLNDNLMSPLNARGNPGHVSSVTYAVSLTNNVLTSMKLLTSVALRPLGYTKDIETTLFFTLN